MEGFAQLAADSGDDALHLAHGKHAAKETVAGVVAPALVAQHGHTVVNAHRLSGNVGIAVAVELFLLKDMHQFDEVGPSAKVAGLGEIAVEEDVAGAQENEPRARGELPGHRRHVVLSACRQASGTKGETVVPVGYGIKQPFNILLAGDNARQTEDLERRVVGMHAHEHVAFIAHRHDG